jgi:hypothetical protein
MAVEDQPKADVAAEEPESVVEEEDQGPPVIPDMEQAQHIFLLELANSQPELVPDVQEIKEKIMEKVSWR